MAENLLMHADEAGVVAVAEAKAAAAVASHAADATAHVTSAERSEWGAKYDKPSGGIPYSHLTAEVKAMLDGVAANADAIDAEADARGDADDELDSRVSALEGTDSGKSVRTIAGEEAATAAAAIVAGADASYDTLKEIADWIKSDTTGAAKMAADIETLKGGKVDKEAGKGLFSGSYEDLTDKPTIPSVDATLTQQGAAADAKAVGDALRGGFTGWRFSGVPYLSTVELRKDTFSSSLIFYIDGVSYYGGAFSPSSRYDEALSASITVEIDGQSHTITAVRHAFPPTKTSQLTNDGDGSAANVAYVLSTDSRLTDARTPTAHHATHSTGGTDAIAPADIGAAASADLPYRLVEPGKWEFSGSGVLGGESIDEWYDGRTEEWNYQVRRNGSGLQQILVFSSEQTTLNFTDLNITATRASLPGHLCDRAVNLVNPTVTAGTPAWTWSDGLAHGTPAYLYNDAYGDYMWGFDDGYGGHSYYDALERYLAWNGTGDGDSEEVSFSYYDENEGTDVTVTATLETPYVSDVAALALPDPVSGKVRDFMVRLVVPENMPAFAWPANVAYETEDGQMPDVSEPGVYLLAFTESSAGSDRFELFCRKMQEVEAEEEEES